MQSVTPTYCSIVYFWEVKKARKKSIAFSLAVVYSLVAGLLSGYGYDLYAQKTNLQQNSAQEFYSMITGSQAGGALQPQKKYEVGFDSKDDTDKKSFREFSALLLSADNFVTLFNNYAGLLPNLRCLTCKSAIIFPFHYFW